LRWEDNSTEILERIRQVLKFSGYRGRGVKNCLNQSLDILKILADYNHRYDENLNLKYDFSEDISFVNKLCVFFRKIVSSTDLIMMNDYDILVGHEYYIQQVLSLTGFEYEYAQILQNKNRELFFRIESISELEKICYGLHWFVDNDIFFESMKYAIGYRHEPHPTSFQWFGNDYSNYYMFRPASSVSLSE
jgi:hypothetical protein